ncbi:unnamed protein product [Didymodactylos carnosus]|uniref:Transmembrane protein 45B n=1 Tax=Didymodactylos carnosus TaxID=1234261 RepID=A0A815M227_9BILA|nr:unnamed protein product [Didymodactylos carnosus]CAF1417054.1 unnamed protein product [Didymodactylos carnosus]CAF4157976.1 unnamed protein product [Didymodactylos carnosus]CAF4302335.1 unnamed protein product [Didymodactylos carnosus]
MVRCLPLRQRQLEFRGAFFIAFALWWHINNCIRYLKSRDGANDDRTNRSHTKFRGSVTYSCFYLPCKSLRCLPIESILKILITSIHFTIELITGYSPEPRSHIRDENSHHTAMLFGFFLGAWIEILVHYKVPLPPRIPQTMGFLAFAIEALMMVFHLHARNMVDAHIHQLLGLTAACSMVGALAECFSPNSFWLIVARSLFAMTQGTWFLQAAFVLWPRTTNPLFIWDLNSHRSISLLTMSYAYHLAGNAFLLIMVYLLIYKFSSTAVRLEEEGEEESASEYKLIMSMNNADNDVESV